MWRQKTDRRLIAAGLFILALVIGFNAWQDMQPKKGTVRTATLTAYTIVADQQAAEAAGNDASASVIFWAGGVVGTPPSFVPSPLKPVILRQQSSMPLFTVETLPTNFSQFFAALDQPVAQWSATGGLVNDIYIDYTNPNPDFGTLGPLANGLRGHFENSYWVVVGLRRTPEAWPSETRTKLANMLKAVEFFVYALEDVAIKGETILQTITRIDAEGLPFMLRSTTMPDYAALMREMPEGKQYFGGFILDPAKTNHQKVSK